MGISQATRGYLENVGLNAPAISSTTAPTVNTVVLAWSQQVSLTPFGSMPSSYTIIPPVGGGPVTVTNVTLLDSTHLQLTTTDQENGGAYQLNVSQGIVINGGTKPNFATSVFFTGNNVALTIIGVQLINSTNLLVNYSRAVQSSTATLPTNYVFVPALMVDSAQPITPMQYLIKTVTMNPNTAYTLTVSNVLALDGSSI